MENNATQAQDGQQPQQGQTDPQQGAGEAQPKDYKALYEEAVKESRKWEKRSKDNLEQLNALKQSQGKPDPTIEERIARNPDRGLAIAPGQTLADIFYEREALYNHYATLRCDARQKTPQQCARWIAEHLPPLPGLPTA